MFACAWSFFFSLQGSNLFVYHLIFIASKSGGGRLETKYITYCNRESHRMPQEYIEGIFNSAVLVRVDFREEVMSELRQKKAWYPYVTDRSSERLGSRGEKGKGMSALREEETHAS